MNFNNTTTFQVFFFVPFCLKIVFAQGSASNFFPFLCSKWFSKRFSFSSKILISLSIDYIGWFNNAFKFRKFQELGIRSIWNFHRSPSHEKINFETKQILPLFERNLNYIFINIIVSQMFNDFVWNKTRFAIQIFFSNILRLFFFFAQWNCFLFFPFIMFVMT